MTDFSSFSLNLISTEVFLSVIKIIILVVFFIYGLFTFIVVRQVALMNQTFQTDIGGFFNLLAYVHFFAVVAVFILSLVIL